MAGALTAPTAASTPADTSDTDDDTDDDTPSTTATPAATPAAPASGLSSISNPFAQAIIAEGKKRGYSDMAIAGALGNLKSESSWDPTAGGDKDGSGNASSFGGAQWRGDRFDNLKATAARLGTTWQDPNAQSQYYWDEMDGKYPGAVNPSVGGALKAATTPQDAAAAAMAFERPKGFDPNNPSSVPSWTDRLANTQAIIGGGGDVPAANAQPASGTGTPGAQTMPGYSLDPSTGIYTLNGQTQAPQAQPDNSLGARLQSLAVALMARDNPNGAQVLQTQLNQQRQQALDLIKQNNSSSKWNTSNSPVGDGKYLQQTNDQGGVRLIPNPDIAQDSDSPAKQSFYKQFQANNQQVDTNAALIDKANALQDALVNNTNPFHVTIGQRGQAMFQNFTGTSDANTQKLKDFDALLNQGVGSIISAEKGQPTQYKMKQAMDQYLPAGSNMDDKQVYDALDRMKTILRTGHQTAANANISMAKQYPDLAAGGQLNQDGTKLGSYQTAYANQMKGFADADAARAPLVAQWTKTRNAALAPPTNGATPGGFGSFYQNYNK